MGVKNLTRTLLATAGRPFDLADYRDCGGIPCRRYDNDDNDNNNNSEDEDDSQSQQPQAQQLLFQALQQQQRRRRRRRRPLRIGIDVSLWICRAAYGHGDMLGDERHLSRAGRAELLQVAVAAADTAASNAVAYPDDRTIREYIQTCTRFVLTRVKKLQQQTQASILVVLDGATPPIKYETAGRRRRAQRAQYQAQRDAPPQVKTGTTRTREEVVEIQDQDDDGDGDGDDDDEEEALLDQRSKAFRRAGAGPYFDAIVAELIYALRTEFDQQLKQRAIAQTSQRRRRRKQPQPSVIAFMVAPAEADGQLAYLSRKGYIDLVVTEDADLIAYGATPILYKLLNWIGGDNSINNNNNNNNNAANQSASSTSGILLRRCDWAALTVDLMDPINSSKSASFSNPPKWMDWTPTMMAILCAAAGCDYLDNLPGIGLKTAMDIIQAAFLGSDGPTPTNTAQKDAVATTRSPLERVVNALLEKTWARRSMTGNDQKVYRRHFCAALIQFQHAVVYDPIRQQCCHLQPPPSQAYETQQQDECDDSSVGLAVDDLDASSLLADPVYAKMVHDWEKCTQHITGPLLPSGLAPLVAQGWLHPRTLQIIRRWKPTTPQSDGRCDHDEDDDIPNHVRHAMDLYGKTQPIRLKSAKRGPVNMTDSQEGHQAEDARIDKDVALIDSNIDVSDEDVTCVLETQESQFNLDDEKASNANFEPSKSLVDGSPPVLGQRLTQSPSKRRKKMLARKATAKL